MATIASVTSADDTKITYRQLGQGPGIVILHGAVESSHSHIELAEILSPHFTVYLPDRRGRGLSGPADRTTYSMTTEIEDLSALLTKTGAHYVLGVSSGALIMLQSALNLGSSTIQKAAIFEPPVLVQGAEHRKEGYRRYEEEMDRGDVVGAMVTGMLGAEMGPPWLQKMPRWILRLLTRLMMWMEEEPKSEDGPPTMRMLAPTIHFDTQLVMEMAGPEQLQRLKGIESEVLLLGGSVSPQYLKTGVRELEKVIPHARRVEWEGLNHGATGNKNRRGAPEVVAKVLQDFFGDSK